MSQCLKEPALDFFFFFLLKKKQQPMRRCYQMWKYGNVQFQHITKIDFCCHLLKILRYWNEKGLKLDTKYATYLKEPALENVSFSS